MFVNFIHDSLQMKYFYVQCASDIYIFVCIKIYNFQVLCGVQAISKIKCVSKFTTSKCCVVCKRYLKLSVYQNLQLPSVVWCASDI